MSLAAALAALDRATIARDTGRLVRERSVTGEERGAAICVVRLARALGLRAALDEHDLDALRAHPDHPGEEAPRTELVGATVTLPGRDPHAPRLCLNGHVDVVPAGAAAWTDRTDWTRDPWEGAIDGDCVHGRGAVDMKGGVVAALHALGALRAAGPPLPGDVVMQVVASEEDGGLGTFAALQRDADFAACLIPEPTERRIVCAHGGALTFTGVVRGRAAHAAKRLEGVSAIDRYLPIHAALHAHEQAINARPRHPLLAADPLPYPLLVGRLDAGRWSSQVPDELRFEGRLGVPVGESPADARAGLERAVADATDDAGPPVRITWSGGQFGPGATDVRDPWVGLVRDAAAAELGSPPPLAGVGYGCDMRLYRDHAIPCVLFGPSGIERAHAVDERVAIDDLLTVARVIVRSAVAFAATQPADPLPRRTGKDGP